MGAIAAIAPAAFAATVRVEGGRIIFDAAADEVNDLLLFDDGTTLTIDDTGATPVTAGAGCVQGGDPTTAECPVQPATFNLGDEDDELTSFSNIATTVNSGAGDDAIFTADGADTLNGDAGDDGLTGGGGNDTLNGGEGDDGCLFGGDGNDTVLGGPDNDSCLRGEAGNDTVDGGDGHDSDLEGGDGDDTVLGGSGFDDSLDGNDGNDVLDGGSGNDSDLDGGAGNDTVRGGDGDDSNLFGGSGPEPTADAPQADIVDGGNGNDSGITGGNGNDTLTGGPGDDSLGSGFFFATDEGNDSYSGGPGNDSMSGSEGDGADTWNGNEGFDSYSASAYGLDVSLSSDGAANDGSANEGDNILNVESLAGGAGNDAISGSGTTRFLNGNSGNDTIFGGPASESIDGDEGDDGINGGGGNDEVFGGSGNDGLSGGEGNDYLQGGSGSDTLFGNNGEDTASWTDKSLTVNVIADGVANDGEFGEGDNLAGDVENIETGSGPDVVTGTAANNLITTNGGDDTINVRDSSADIVSCGEGKDNVALDNLDRLDTAGFERCEIATLGGPSFTPSISITTKTRGRGRTVAVEITCPLAALVGCEGTLRLRASGVRNAGSRRVTIPAADSKTYNVRLSNAARRRIRRGRGRLRTTFTLTVVDASLSTSTITRTATLRR